MPLISKGTKIFIIVIVVLFLLYLAWYFLAGRKSREEISLPTPPIQTETQPPVQPAPEEKSAIELAFENASEIEPQSQKAKNVNSVLRPILESVFNVVNQEDGQEIVGVKLVEELDSSLTYYFNRQLTEKERDAILAGLGEAGWEIVGTNDEIYTIKKESQIWTITFYLNEQDSSRLEIAF